MQPVLSELTKPLYPRGNFSNWLIAEILNFLSVHHKNEPKRSQVIPHKPIYFQSEKTNWENVEKAEQNRRIFIIAGDVRN